MRAHTHTVVICLAYLGSNVVVGADTILHEIFEEIITYRWAYMYTEILNTQVVCCECVCNDGGDVNVQL